jgi:hypothetical protein
MKKKKKTEMINHYFKADFGYAAQLTTKQQKRNTVVGVSGFIKLDLVFVEL